MELSWPIVKIIWYFLGGSKEIHGKFSLDSRSRVEI
jgi:hypothetical protein